MEEKKATRKFVQRHAASVVASDPWLFFAAAKTANRSPLAALLVVDRSAFLSWPAMFKMLATCACVPFLASESCCAPPIGSHPTACCRLPPSFPSIPVGFCPYHHLPGSHCRLSVASRYPSVRPGSTRGAAVAPPPRHGDPKDDDDDDAEPLALAGIKEGQRARGCPIRRSLSLSLSLTMNGQRTKAGPAVPLRSDRSPPASRSIHLARSLLLDSPADRFSIPPSIARRPHSIHTARRLPLVGFRSSQPCRR